jgi:hypothetical protein
LRCKTFAVHFDFLKQRTDSFSPADVLNKVTKVLLYF